MDYRNTNEQIGRIVAKRYSPFQENLHKHDSGVEKT